MNSSRGFSKVQREAILLRDGEACQMHGFSKDCRGRGVVVNHRANRGAGGSPAANILPNGCAICPVCNGLLESSSSFAEEGRRRGVKLSRWDDPTQVPLWSVLWGEWLVLTEKWSYQTGERDGSKDARNATVSGTEQSGFVIAWSQPVVVSVFQTTGATR